MSFEFVCVCACIHNIQLNCPSAFKETWRPGVNKLWLHRANVVHWQTQEQKRAKDAAISNVTSKLPQLQLLLSVWLQSLVLLQSWPPHPRSTVQPVLHDADELLVGQLVVMIHVKDLKDGVDEVSRQLQSRSHVHGSRKLICRQRTQTTYPARHLRCNLFFWSARHNSAQYIFRSVLVQLSFCIPTTVKVLPHREEGVANIQIICQIKW